MPNRKCNNTCSQVVNVIYPTTLKQASLQMLPICEVFMDKIIKAQAKKIYFEAHEKLKYVESNNDSVKDFITLILKSGKLDIFLFQIQQLLHKKDEDPKNCLGRLKLIYHKNELSYYFLKDEESSDVKWYIILE